MKRIILLLTLVCVAFAGIAKNWEKEYKKYIKKYDAPIESRTAGSSVGFWRNTWYYNPTFADFAQALSNRSSTATRAAFSIEQAKGVAQGHYRTLVLCTGEDADNLARNIKSDLGALDDEIEVYIVNDNSPNAFVCPDGSMYIHIGLLNMPGITYPHVLGICAHEMTHYKLQHALTHAYAAEKRAKKNNIIAGVVSGLAVAGGVYAATQGYDVSNSVQMISEAATSIAFTDTRNYYFRYSREQEIEADLHAYRFMETSGYGGEYFIDALRMISQYEQPRTDDRDSDHPLTSTRIGLLEYAANHPELKREKPRKTFANVNLR